MKLLDHIVLLASFLVIMIVGTLIYTLAPGAIPDWNTFNWPSNPSTVAQLPDAVVEDDPLLVQGAGIEAIKRHCLNCHSARLIVQNRMSRERWEDNIQWMQETQGLWDLGSDHTAIVDYLSTYYTPQVAGRRGQLSAEQLDWYQLD